MLGDLLFMGTLDAHLIALDRDTGKLVWDTDLDELQARPRHHAAPLVVKDKVIVGNSGGDIPTRGFIDAYDAKTGKRVWRFYTIPATGEPGSETWSDADVLPRGGGATWVTGSYDPELNLIYWGIGNPNPDYYGERSQGRQPLHRVARRARRRHRQAAVALPVHAARPARLGLEPRAGARRRDDQRPARARW